MRNDKEYLKRLAPCGLHCGKCFAFKDGDINKAANDLKKNLESLCRAFQDRRSAEEKSASRKRLSMRWEVSNPVEFYDKLTISVFFWVTIVIYLGSRQMYTGLYHKREVARYGRYSAEDGGGAAGGRT